MEEIIVLSILYGLISAGACISLNQYFKCWWLSALCVIFWPVTFGWGNSSYITYV